MALGNPVLTRTGNVVSDQLDNVYGSYNSTVSGTGSADTGGTIDTLGYEGIRFVLAMSTYRGTCNIQASHDETNWYTIRPLSTDAVASSLTFHWQHFGTYRYWRVVADPNGSNTGTMTVRFVFFKTRPIEQTNGFCGPMAATYQVLASASYTADLPKTLFAVKGPGCKVFINVTAKGGGAMKFNLYSVDPVNNVFGGSTGIIAQLIQSAVVNETGAHIYTVTPNLAAVANSSVQYSGQIFALDTSAYDSGTYTYSVQVENDSQSYAGY